MNTLEIFNHDNKSMAIHWLKTRESFEQSFQFLTCAILFSRCQTNLKFSLKGKTSFDIDAYITVIIPPAQKFSIEAKNSINDFIIFCPSEKLMNKVIKQYALPKDDFKLIFSELQKLSRPNWLNEVMHRYSFERTTAGSHDNDACHFLEAEMMKEIFYLFKEKNIALKNRFNLDSANLDKKSSVVKKTLDYIEVNLLKEINWKKIVAHVGASESVINRKFQKEIEKTTFQYIKDRKLEEASRLLKTRKYNVAEVANILGHEDVSSFIDAFKKKFKTTPAKFLKN
jgi:AraC-like DNA-binding protein